ncbi:YbaB/EbfC family nucleoid-associated protein [Actinomadura sp. 3N407]|uniref:YbaB/EbfC family nucleoid-associated protein n=1 Tax=Actinomadura sp. 3N407 TaxID=3457423 RepID=UPI003FCE66F1
MSEMPGDDRWARLADAQRRLAELRAGTPGTAPEGTGRAGDEQVRVTASGGRVARLELDPRALRRTPEDLGALIAEAANAALDDLRSRADSAEAPPADPSALAATLRDVQDEGLRQMALIDESINEAVARVQARMR